MTIVFINLTGEDLVEKGVYTNTVYKKQGQVTCQISGDGYIHVQGIPPPGTQLKDTSEDDQIIYIVTDTIAAALKDIRDDLVICCCQTMVPVVKSVGDYHVSSQTLKDQIRK